MIPKIIHQTIQDKKNVHDEFLLNINFLKENNQNYRYYLYDDEDIINFIKKNYSNNILNYYNQINPIYGPARADFFRYLLMYETGGVYLDIKSTLDVPLEKVIKTNNYSRNVPTIIISNEQHNSHLTEIKKITNVINIIC